MNTWSASPEDLLHAMRAADLRRAWLVTDPSRGVLRASHPVFEPLAEAVAADPNYCAHEAWFLEIGSASGHLLSACLHRTKRGQAAGGVRFAAYDTVRDFVRDGLRLARGMGHKNALADLWWGGGKGVIARRPGCDVRDPALRERVYRDYGRFMTGLRGCYVTAEDAGTTEEDMASVFATTRHTTCIPERFGGSGNPSVLTAAGVVVAMETARAWLGRGDLAGTTVVLQGLGNVARHMVGELVRRGVARIIASDVDEHAIACARRQHPEAPLEARLVPPCDVSVLAEPCDVLAPNAVGAILDTHTIPTLRTELVCGAANNQLADPHADALRLQERGVLYLPDFLVNRMGIVNCANEAFGCFPGDPAVHAHLDRETEHGIHRRCLDVLERARRSGRPPAHEAQALAEELMEREHPLWGHRTRRILDALLAEGWERREPLR